MHGAKLESAHDRLRSSLSPFVRKTLAYVARLWGREVVLETTLQGKRSLLCYNERGFSMRALK